jgi:hypothetical protein
MEKAPSETKGFFFATAARQFDSFFKAVRREFAHLFDSVGGTEKGANEGNPRSIIHERIKDRERQRLFVANFLPLHIPFDSLTLYEYYFYLSEAVKETQKTNKMQQGGESTNSNRVHGRHK